MKNIKLTKIYLNPFLNLKLRINLRKLHELKANIFDLQTKNGRFKQ